tara:strand:- start:364 stop:483 length:120 start_codon:yes stop_codon:yes gene_type:complete
VEAAVAVVARILTLKVVAVVPVLYIQTSQQSPHHREKLQ